MSEKSAPHAISKNVEYTGSDILYKWPGFIDSDIPIKISVYNIIKIIISNAAIFYT